MLLSAYSLQWTRQCLLASTFCWISQTLAGLFSCLSWSLFDLWVTVSFCSCSLLIWEMPMIPFFLFLFFPLLWMLATFKSFCHEIWSELCLFYSSKYFIQKHGIASEPNLQPGLPRVLHSLISIIWCCSVGGQTGRGWIRLICWELEWEGGCCKQSLIGMHAVMWWSAPLPCTWLSVILLRLWDLSTSKPCFRKFVLHGVKWFYFLYTHWSCSAVFGLLLHSKSFCHFAEEVEALMRKKMLGYY